MTTAQVEFRWRSWRELALAAAILMEASAAAGFAATFIHVSQPVSPWRALGLLALVGFTGHGVGRFMNAVQVRHTLRRVVFGVLLYLSFWLGMAWLAYYPEPVGLLGWVPRFLQSILASGFIPDEFWVVLLILLAWLRSLQLAREPVGADAVHASFRLAVVAWFVLGIFTPLIDLNNGDTSGLWGVFGLFILFSLVASSAGRLAEVDRLRGGSPARFSRSWLAGLAAAILALMALALLAAVLLHSPLSGAVRLVAMLAYMLMMGLILLLMAPIFLLISWLAPLLMGRLDLNLALQGLTTATRAIQDAIRPLMESPAVAEALSFAWVGRFVAVLGVLALLVAAVLLSLNWQRWWGQGAPEEEGELDVSLTNPLDRARQQAQAALERLRARVRPFGQARQLWAAARVRWVYLQLLQWSARRGAPRPPSATPLEFLPLIAGKYPQLTPALELITRAYLRVRYGELPEDEAELQAVMDAWETVRRAR